MLIFIISVFVLDQSKYMSECVVQFQKLVLDHLLFIIMYCLHKNYYSILLVCHLSNLTEYPLCTEYYI